MSTSVLWLAVVPDPCTGLDQPIMDQSGHRLEWQAADRASAEKLIRPNLAPRERHIAGIVSALDWESRRRQKQHAMLTAEPKDGRSATNRGERCHRCSAPTFSPFARFCNSCRKRGPRVRKTA
jgi:hypothetical protein